MGRPKGSRNKKKHVDEKVEAVKTTPSLPTEVREEVKVEKWNPSPDMGKIVPPAEEEKNCACNHKRATHYGGPKDWCNVGGCKCQEFKAQ